MPQGLVGNLSKVIVRNHRKVDKTVASNSLQNCAAV